MANITWGKNRGRNGWDEITEVPTDQSVESINVHLFEGGVGTRRGGSTNVPLTNFGSPFATAPVNALFEFLGFTFPVTDGPLLILVDSSSPTKICKYTGTVGTSLILKDNVAASPTQITAVGLNGKIYFAYSSGVNRLHVLESTSHGGSSLRRAGMGTPAAPTAADGGGVGTYAATLRYYRIAYTSTSSGVIRRSLLGPQLSKTPDGAHVNLTITKPAAISEGETHWEIYGSTDNALYYLITPAIVVGTTTYADTAAPSTYASNQAAPTEGMNTPFPSVRSLGTDGTRLYGLGVWETTAGDSLAPKSGRLYFGPVQDSSVTPYAVDDDERINNTTTLSGWIDLGRDAAGAGSDQGVSPQPVNGVIYAFQSRAIYEVYPTDSPTVPYRRVVRSLQIGNVTPQSIVMAHDRNGTPCCYFLDPVKGPYIVGGSDGLKWCGKDVADVWATINLGATTNIAWGLWYPDLVQVWFGIATGSNNTPNKILVLDVTEQQLDEQGDLRRGWTIYDGDLAAARCAVYWSLSGTSAARMPYVGTASKLLRYNPTGTSDDGTAFQAYAKSGALVDGVDNLRIDRAYVVADANSGVSLQESLIRNIAEETRTSTISLTASGTETVVLKKVEDAALQDAWAVQVQIGDASAVSVSPWHVQVWSGDYTDQGRR